MKNWIYVVITVLALAFSTYLIVDFVQNPPEFKIAETTATETIIEENILTETIIVERSGL